MTIFEEVTKFCVDSRNRKEKYIADCEEVLEKIIAEINWPADALTRLVPYTNPSSLPLIAFCETNLGDSLLSPARSITEDGALPEKLGWLKTNGCYTVGFQLKFEDLQFRCVLDLYRAPPGWGVVFEDHTTVEFNPTSKDPFKALLGHLTLAIQRFIKEHYRIT